MAKRNLYNDLPKGVRAMIDDYTGPRIPSEADIKKEAFEKCMCGDSECGNCKLFLNCVFHKERCTIVWKTLGKILLGLLILAASVGLAYVYFILLPNGVALLLFDDTECGYHKYLFQNYGKFTETETMGNSLFNQWCHSKIGWSVYDHMTGFVSSLLVCIITIPLIFGILQFIFQCGFCCGACSDTYYDDYDNTCCHTREGKEITPCLGISLLTGSYIAFCLIGSVWIGKQFAINVISGCDIYSVYATTVRGMCYKYTPLEMGMGASTESVFELPGTYDDCTRCMVKGYFSSLVFILILPIVIILIIIAIVKCKRKYDETLDEIRNRYESDQTQNNQNNQNNVNEFAINMHEFESTEIKISEIV
jgi:hypothetical protein